MNNIRIGSQLLTKWVDERKSRITISCTVFESQLLASLIIRINSENNLFEPICNTKNRLIIKKNRDGQKITRTILFCEVFNDVLSPEYTKRIY